MGRCGEIERYSEAELAALVPWPGRQANKYSRGKAVLVVGSARYPGAAWLAARGCLRMGAGYTEVLCAREAAEFVRGAGASLVVSPWDELLELSRLDGACGGDDPGCYPISCNDARLDAARRGLFPRPRRDQPMAYLVGSGLDAGDPDAERLTCAVLRHALAPVVVDGGGLGALAGEGGRSLARRRFVDGLATVVTPHAGEAARLVAALGLPAEDAASTARRLSLATGAVVVCKGPVTYVSDGEVVVCMDEGTPALARAGTGDVLAGMTTALLAQGMGAVDACVLATTLHARAGRAAAEALTEPCAGAEDVPDFLPEAIRGLGCPDPGHEKAPRRARRGA